MPSRRAELAAKPWVVLQHAPHEGPGLLTELITAAGHDVAAVHLDAAPELPAPETVGAVVIMGGAMGVHDTDRHPWLAPERAWIADTVGAGVPVLGICLGAQLLAAALGAEVTTGPAPEIGIGEVELTAEGRADPVLGGNGARLPAVHWHGDTFAIPDGAVHLASSDRYVHQAFRYGHAVYGLQFHLELDDAMAEAWRPELPPGVDIDTGRAAVEVAGRRVLGRFVELAGRVLSPDGRAPAHSQVTSSSMRSATRAQVGQNHRASRGVPHAR